MFPEVTIEGMPYERGRRYGATVPALIRHSIASYARLFAHRRGLDWTATQAEALHYLPLLTEVAPDLLEEMRGIAAGAELQLGEIVALNVRTELMAGIGIGVTHPDGPAALERNRAAGVPQHVDEPAPPTSANPPVPDDGECTTAAVTGAASAEGGVFLAQTWDWQGDQRGACVLLRVRGPGQPELLTLTEAGMLAKIGVNRAGVAVGLNLLRSQADGRELGMPVHILLRKMLQAGSFDAARALADLAPAAGSSCVTLAGAEDKLVSLELTPGGVGEIWAANGMLAHANHCLDADAAAGECAIEPASTSRERYDRARVLLAEAHGKVDVATLQAILRDHADEPKCICRHPNPLLARVDRGESVCGVVIDLKQLLLYVAPDVPCTVPFSQVSL
ncbi:MAG: peptidase C45 [Oscillochloris sp.]|nr:peptidase C45 [Oscillochloris sp.]